MKRLAAVALLGAAAGATAAAVWLVGAAVSNLPPYPPTPNGLPHP